MYQPIYFNMKTQEPDYTGFMEHLMEYPFHHIPLNVP